jgi:hypothetical protein
VYPVSSFDHSRFSRGAIFLYTLSLSIFILLYASGDAATEQRQPSPITTNPVDVQKIIDASRRAEDLRRAVLIAEALAKQLTSLLSQTPSSDSARRSIANETSEAQQVALRLPKLEPTRQSFASNTPVFRWRFGFDIESLNTPDSPFGLKSRIKRLQDEYTQNLNLSVADNTVSTRFSTLFSDLSSEVDKIDIPESKKQFDQNAAKLNEKYAAESNALFGSELAERLRNSSRSEFEPLFSDQQQFEVPSADKINVFKKNVQLLFDEYNTHLRRLSDAQDLSTLGENARQKLTQVGPTLIAALRGDLERAAASANVVERDRQSLSTWLFVSLTAAFVIVIAMLLFVPRLYSPEVQPLVFRSPFFLQLFTVYVLSSSIVILALGSFLESTNLATLLAGISGYVLGQLGKDGSHGKQFDGYSGQSADTLPQTNARATKRRGARGRRRSTAQTQ